MAQHPRDGKALLGGLEVGGIRPVHKVVHLVEGVNLTLEHSVIGDQRVVPRYVVQVVVLDFPAWRCLFSDIVASIRC